jgi:hypothetical protein
VDFLKVDIYMTDNNILTIEDYLLANDSNVRDKEIYYDTYQKLSGNNIDDCNNPFILNGRDFRKCINNKLLVAESLKTGCRFCANFSSTSPEVLYHTLKVIQNQVRVPSSEYTMNLAALNAYERPELVYQEIPVAGGSSYLAPPLTCWNQMSDRKQPHVQKVVTSSGSTYGGNSLRRSLVRMRPGAMSPGGIGVDIKHNSYDRYLNRLKGKGPLRRGVIPPGFGGQVPFNPAFPIYGGKTVKTNIVSGCNCLPVV